MKITTAIWLAGILCLTSAGFSKAGPNDLVGAVIDSSEAMQAEDLESAKNLSGKFIDGSVDFQVTTPVQAYSGDAGISKTKKLPALTAPKKMSLSAEVPLPAGPGQGTTGEFQKPGFVNSLTEAALSVVITPVTGTVAGATFGKEYGETHAGKVGGVVGLVVGGAVGLVAGVAIGVVRAGVNLFQAVVHLFRGNL